MVDQESEAFKAARNAQIKAREGGFLNERTCLAAALEAYEAARPKLPTITGLPEVVDGKRIVAWRYGKPNADQVWVCMHGTMIRGAAYMREKLIAITEADNA